MFRLTRSRNGLVIEVMRGDAVAGGTGAHIGQLATQREGLGTQARLFFSSQSVEQGHVVSALVFELSKVTLAHVRPLL